MFASYYYVALRSDGTANSIWRYDHEPDDPPAGAVQLPSLSDQQWAAWFTNKDGWRWNAVTHLLEELPPPIIVPNMVTMLQGCLAMQRTPDPSDPTKTLYDRVKQYVSTSTNVELQIAWERASQLDRRGNLVNMVAQQLHVSDAQLDHLFTFAATIIV